MRHTEEYFTEVSQHGASGETNLPLWDLVEFLNEETLKQLFLIITTTTTKIIWIIL